MIKCVYVSLEHEFILYSALSRRVIYKWTVDQLMCGHTNKYEHTVAQFLSQIYWNSTARGCFRVITRYHFYTDLRCYENKWRNLLRYIRQVSDEQRALSYFINIQLLSPLRRYSRASYRSSWISHRISVISRKISITELNFPDKPDRNCSGSRWSTQVLKSPRGIKLPKASIFYYFLFISKTLFYNKDFVV